MSYKLSGINPLAYMGVEPSTPPQMVVETRPPTINDTNFNLGTYWLIAAPPPTTDWELWILVDLSQGIATWKQLFPGSGSGGADQFDEDTGIAVPALGIILVKGGENINTVGDNVNKITINLNESIHLPNTSADGSQGVLFLDATGGVGGSTFLHNYGTSNTFVGDSSGNLTLTVGSATDNSGFGNRVLNNLTTGSGNSIAGSTAGSSLTSGSFNCATGTESMLSATSAEFNSSYGTLSLTGLLTGTQNCAFGYAAGSSYSGSESNNILIGNTGTLGESDTIRIGDTQTSAFMAGVYNQSVGSTNAQVFIDNTGKLGTMESGSSGNVIITTFTTSGTWTKNPDTKLVKVIVWNGGGGGGSGGRGLSAAGFNNTWGGGAGGSGGTIMTDDMPANFFNATETVIIGMGGSGGAGVAVDNTAGNAGADAGVSSFGNITLLLNVGGTAGKGGILNTTAGTVFIGPSLSNGMFNFPDGITGFIFPGNASSPGSGYFNAGKNGSNITGRIATAASGTIASLPYYTAAMGGGGGGANSGTAQAGGTGGGLSQTAGFSSSPAVLLLAGGVGGIETGTIDGTDGASYPTIVENFPCGGLGGGGGGGQSSGLVAGIGGIGGIPSGGGGGGGASLNGTLSGAGGAGGDGMVLVIEYL